MCGNIRGEHFFGAWTSVRALFNFGGVMFKVKINKKGQITIPKAFRDCYNYASGTTFKINVSRGVLELEPLVYCRHCGRAMPAELRGALVCADCSPLISFTFH